MARHAAVDIALIFGTPPTKSAKDQYERTGNLEHFFRDLRANGAKIDSSDSALQKLAELRGTYEPFLCALATYFQIEIPPMIAHDVTADNWQRSAWLERAPGIGSLPATHSDDHF